MSVKGLLLYVTIDPSAGQELKHAIDVDLAVDRIRQAILGLYPNRISDSAVEVEVDRVIGTEE